MTAFHRHITFELHPSVWNFNTPSVLYNGQTEKYDYLNVVEKRRVRWSHQNLALGCYDEERADDVRELRVFARNHFDDRFLRTLFITKKGKFSDAMDYLDGCDLKQFRPFLHDGYIQIVMALESLRLPVYVLMWILDKIPEFTYKREILKVRLIESVYASCKRVIEQRSSKQLIVAPHPLMERFLILKIQ